MNQLPKRLVLASNNAHKLQEFSRILAPLGIQVVSQREMGVFVNPEENGNTFMENAAIKAKAVFDCCGEATVADDSGLCVDALQGAPGIYSARYAGEDATDDERIAKLLEELSDVAPEQRGAHFACAICCILPGGEQLQVYETCEGTVAMAKQGDNGFGYDPVFLVEGQSFAQLDGEKKDRISHRGRALRAFARRLSEIWKEN